MITLDKWMNPRPLLPEQRRSFSDAALKAMIIPLMIEQLLQMVVGLADTMMVSYAGEAVVAGVGLDTSISAAGKRKTPTWRPPRFSTWPGSCPWPVWR